MRALDLEVRERLIEADLDTAQAAKFEHICRKLRLRPGERLTRADPYP